MQLFSSRLTPELSFTGLTFYKPQVIVLLHPLRSQAKCGPSVESSLLKAGLSAPSNPPKARHVTFCVLSLDLKAPYWQSDQCSPVGFHNLHADVCIACMQESDAVGVYS